MIRYAGLLAILLAVCSSGTLCAGEAGSGEAGAPGAVSPGSEGAPVIYAIRIVGNHITRRELIEREMSLKPGARAYPDALETDRLHLLSLGLFNQIEMSVASDLGRAVVLVRITEQFYIYPYPIFDYDPANPDKRKLGITLNHANFRGFGEKLTAGWWDGYERGFLFQHRDPWFSYGGIYGVGMQVYINRMEFTGDDSLRHSAEVESYSIRIRRRLDRDRWIGVETEWEERASDYAEYTLALGSRDRIFALRLYYESDRRDYLYYPSDGFYTLLALKTNRMIDSTHTFFRESLDVRAYKKLGGVIFAARGTVLLTQKKLPFYRRAELTQLEIRSREPLGRRGERSLSGSLEARFNILRKRYISLPDIPLAGPYLQKLKLSIEGVLFLDNGFVYDGEKKWDIPLVAYGCGLQFQIPYLESAHALLGWSPDDPWDDPALILETGVTF